MNLAQKQPLLNKADRCVVSSKDLAAFRARIIQIKSEDDDFYQAGMQFEPGEPEKALEGVWQELLKGSAPNQPTAPPRFRDAELDNLWKELAECQEENGFFALPKGLKRLFPLVKDKLMVREYYIKLVRIVEERSGVQLLPVSGDAAMEDIAVAVAGMAPEKGYIERAMIVTGTPGIGKSMWLILLLTLLAKAGICVVLNSAESENDKFLLSRDGCFSAHDLSSFKRELRERSTFLLSDSRTPDLYPAMTILVSSPSKKIIYNYNKKAEDFYMPVWTPEEIIKLRNECYPYRSESDVVELYAYWGGIVRWVLEHPNTPKWRKKLNQAADAMDNDKLEKACRSENDDKVSNRIVHHIPTADLTDVEEVRLASPYVSDLVCQKLQRRKVDQIATFLESTRGDHACSVMRGQLFESYVMYRQSEGGQREYAVKPPQGFSDPAGVTLPPVSFPKASVASFMKLGDIKPDPSDAHKTWWPLDKKFKSVDFIRQPNEVCQVTLNPNHDPLDLDKIMECFEAVEDYSKQDKGLVFSYIVASELFDDQVDIPGIEFPERSQPSRACKVGGLKAKYKAHVEKIQWRIMAVPYQ